MAKEEANLEENDKAYEPQAINLTKMTWKEVIKDDGFYVFSTSGGESNALPLIESEPVNVIIDSGATCNLMSEQGKLELLETHRKVYAYASQQPLKAQWKMHVEHLCT